MKCDFLIGYNKKKWFYLNELGDQYIVRNDKKGQYALDTLNIDKQSNYRGFLMFKKNKTIEYITYNNLKVKVENKTYTIKTDAGIFKCLKYTLRL